MISKGKSKVLRWCYFIVGSGLLYLFAFVFLPYASKGLGFESSHNKIIEEKIEAGAWYYIFVEKLSLVLIILINKLKYYYY